MKRITRPRVRVQPFIDAEIVKHLERYCGANRVTVTAVIEQALKQFLDGTSDATLTFRRLDRLGGALRRNQRDLELVSQTIAVWIKLWFAHTHPIPDESKEAARTAAELRYKQFIDHVAELFCDGKCFVDDLPRDVLADESELNDAATIAAVAHNP